MDNEYYKIVYEDTNDTPLHKGLTHHFEKIDNFVEPTKDELLYHISCMYAVVYEFLINPRTKPIPTELYDWFSNFKDKIDNSNITSECIRHHQNPSKQKIPKDVKEKMEQWRIDYEQRRDEPKQS